MQNARYSVFWRFWGYYILYVQPKSICAIKSGPILKLARWFTFKRYGVGLPGFELEFELELESLSTAGCLVGVSVISLVAT